MCALHCEDSISHFIYPLNVGSSFSCQVHCLLFHIPKTSIFVFAVQVSLCLFFACVCIVLSQDYPSTRVGLHDSGDHHVFPNPELALSKVGTGAMATKLQHTESAKYSVSLIVIIVLEHFPTG
jgi:hypothetical protein